jgi:hypothetical protein
LLIVEDDVHYARLIRDLSRDKGFKVLHAVTGAGLWRWRASFAPLPFPSTCFCRTCWAGACLTI